jgi:hypothetical protein
MASTLSISAPNKLTIACLIIATAGVIIQIISGVPYPKVPPVFFILLVPAALLFFFRWRWLPVLVIIPGLFLTLGLFTSGAATRLSNFSSVGGSVGLWIQMVGVVIAIIAAIVSLTKRS